jgi:hypothetical protein
METGRTDKLELTTVDPDWSTAVVFYRDVDRREYIAQVIRMALPGGSIHPDLNARGARSGDAGRRDVGTGARTNLGSCAVSKKGNSKKRDEKLTTHSVS